MKALYSLILASGTKEALFAALWLALDEEPGTFADVDFASLRTTASRFGVALSESQIRKRVKELEKLDVLAVAPRRERGRFDLLVYQPAPNRFNVDATAPKPEPATPLFDAAFGKGVESFADRDRAVPATLADRRFRANSVSAPVGRDALAQLRADADFAAVSETETRTESVAQSIAEPTAPGVADHFRGFTKMIQTPTFAEVRVVRPTSTIPAVSSVAPGPTSREPVAAPLEEINIKNKTINQPAKDFETLGEDVGDQRERNRVRAIPERLAAPRDGSRAVAADAPSVAGTQPGLEPERRPDVADVRSLVDFASPKVAALRREIAERVWEPTVHPDLIDRLTAAVVLRVGGATRSTVFALIREARDAKSLFERSNGRAGKRTLWQTATLRLKRLFENAGWVWSPTRFADEPRPFDVRRQARSFERARTPEETPATPENAETLSVEELATTAAGFEPSELDLSFADFSCLVARRRGIADACESRGVALEIRNALRELAKRELATA